MIKSDFPYRQLIILAYLCAFSLLIESCANNTAVVPTKTQVFNPSHIPSAPQSPTLTMTFTPTLSPAQQATREFQNSIFATAQSEMAILPGCGAPIDRNYSPDGNWVAIQCVNYGMGVYNSKDLANAWFFSYYETFGLKYENGNHFGSLMPKHWSVDGKYLYFAPFIGGDGGCEWYIEGQALLQLDLSTGKLSEILSPTIDSTYYNFSFSHDDKYLAYFETWKEHPVLNLLDLVAGTKQEVPLGKKYSGAGFLIWSPDNKQALFSARSGEECEGMIYYIVLMNMNNHSQKIILEEKNSRLSSFPMD